MPTSRKKTAIRVDEIINPVISPGPLCGRSTDNAPTDRSPCKICGRAHGGYTCFTEHPDQAPPHLQQTFYKKAFELNKERQKPSSASTAPTAQKPSAQDADTSSALIPFSMPSDAKSAITKSTIQLRPEEQWFLDSCASYHSTPHRQLFTSYFPLREADLSPSDYMEGAQGLTSKPTGVGTILLDVQDGSLLLKNVRHVPSFNSNLISVGALARDGNKLQYSPDSTYQTITTPSGAEFEAQLAANDVYMLTGCLDPGDASSYTLVTTRSGKEANRPDEPMPRHEHPPAPRTTKVLLPIESWHRRLAHLNPADLLRLASDPLSPVGISGPKHLPFCDVCRQAKQTRQYSKTPRSRLTKPLARVHLDIAGGGRTLDFDNENDAAIPSRLGSRYVLIITDDATRYRWLCYLTEKSASVSAFRTWLQNMKNRGYTAPACMVSDNEFRSEAWLNTYCTEGIEWQPSAPYSPWQNAVSERGIRLLFERARSFMLDAPYMHRKFWSDALSYAQDLTNHLPMSVPLYNSMVPGGVDQNPTIRPSPY